MTSLFCLDSSIRVDGSITRAVADSLEAAFVASLPSANDLKLIRRDVGQSPLPATVWPFSLAASFTPADQQTPEQRGAAEVASDLADELARADAYIFATPLYNFGVSQHLKTWMDILITEPRFAPRTTTIAGRPAMLIVARGGAYGAGTPREGWDHATAWIVRILKDVWGLDVQVIECELTLAPGRPEMAAFEQLAAQNLEDAHVRARELGAQLAAKVGRAVAV